MFFGLVHTAWAVGAPMRVATTRLPNRELVHCDMDARSSLLLPPALSECSHCGLASRSIAVRRCPIFVMPEGERPHPGAACWSGVDFEDAADNGAIREHVEVLVTPLTGRTKCRF